ncbi:hypothetical protein [Yersinia pekkanenii]|uniref:Uncharacterized protein n=1 Tax=Yersinia pekkanenii TaxID=1288385 RepID=A0A0T9NEE0_9GAMM|nr:hypothetical protein [Yersinia pekkanenii]CNH01777.1 Uncharacterised protein [Yersinia pekkanenii]CRY64020.1 Uncharacterised protein [Yersinia pekkanenii]
MDIKGYILIILLMFVFTSPSVMADNQSEDNVCFYSNDNYSEKDGGKKFCVPYYTEDEWLFNQWNNTISSIKIPSYFRVDIFSDY